MLIRKAFAELIGTCFLVMVVVGSGIMAENLSSDNLNILIANTLATGAGLTTLIWIFINVSGAHFNPAVTLSRMFTDTFTGISNEFVAPFILFQLIGAITAMLFMRFVNNK